MCSSQRKTPFESWRRCHARGAGLNFDFGYISLQIRAASRGCMDVSVEYAVRIPQVPAQERSCGRRDIPCEDLNPNLSVGGYAPAICDRARPWRRPSRAQCHSARISNPRHRALAAVFRRNHRLLSRSFRRGLLECVPRLARRTLPFRPLNVESNAALSDALGQRRRRGRRTRTAEHIGHPVSGW